MCYLEVASSDLSVERVRDGVLEGQVPAYQRVQNYPAMHPMHNTTQHGTTAHRQTQTCRVCVV